MNYEQIIQSRANYADDAAFLEWANTVTYTYRTGVMVNERTMADVIGLPSAYAIMQALRGAAQQMPELSMVVAWMSPEKQGVDMGAESTRAQMEMLTAAGVITPQQRDALLDMARTASYPFGEPLTQSDLDTARLEQSREALRIKLQTAFNAKINEIDAMTEVTATDVTITLS